MFLLDDLAADKGTFPDPTVYGQAKSFVMNSPLAISGSQGRTDGTA